MVEIKEMLRDWRDGGKEKLVMVHQIDSDDKEMIFRRMYAYRRSARYDSARHYRFADESLEQEFLDWKDKNETIEMFYGGGVVD